MKNTILLLLMSAILLSCSKEENKEELNTHLAASVVIAVETTDGQDLLDPENPNGFRSPDDIKLYYQIDGEKVFYYEPKLDDSRGLRFTKTNGKHSIIVFLNYDKNVEHPVTYIQWNEHETDTIKASYHYVNGVIVMKVWYNGELKWEEEDHLELYNKYGVANYIEIVK